MRTLRIFISSPGDVAEERKLALQVIAALQQSRRSQVRLDPLVWEHWPLPASGSAQAGVDARLAGTEEIDIVIFILWHKMGSPLEPGIVKQDGSPYLSGTEREFDLMLEAFQRSGNQRPLTLVYARKDEEGFMKQLADPKLDRDAIRELLDQQQALEQ